MNVYVKRKYCRVLHIVKSVKNSKNSGTLYCGRSLANCSVVEITSASKVCKTCEERKKSK